MIISFYGDTEQPAVIVKMRNVIKIYCIFYHYDLLYSIVWASGMMLENSSIFKNGTTQMDTAGFLIGQCALSVSIMLCRFFLKKPSLTDASFLFP